MDGSETGIEGTERAPSQTKESKLRLLGLWLLWCSIAFMICSFIISFLLLVFLMIKNQRGQGNARTL